MHAATYRRYGASDVVEITEIDKPEPKDDEILVEVHASTVTTADWRLRASAFPRGMWLAGRLFAGLFRPRNKVLGMEFSGIVAKTGANVSRFTVGDAVFGFAGSGAHAEYLTIAETGAIARKPANLDHADAASLPFGATTALVFLRDFARLRAGQRVLVLGASGGVGVHAVQIAKHLGAHVTGIASTDNVDLVASLGADAVIDYRTQPIAGIGETFDVVFDTAGILDFSQAKPLLVRDGLFLPLEFGVADLLAAPFRKLFGSGKRMGLHVSGDTQEDIRTLADLAAKGALRPVIDSRYPLGRIRQAHERVETRHKRGSVVIDVRPPLAQVRAA